jgi:hypothetical protein
VAIARQRGESSGSRRLISALDTTACTTAERANPRISAHRISQNMANAMLSACRSSWRTVLIPKAPLVARR